MAAEGAAADLTNCTLANVVVRGIEKVILIEVHRLLKFLVVKRVAPVTVVEHCIRSRYYGLRSRYGWIERYVTEGSIIVDTASRLRSSWRTESHCSYRQQLRWTRLNKSISFCLGCL